MESGDWVSCPTAMNTCRLGKMKEVAAFLRTAVSEVAATLARADFRTAPGSAHVADGPPEWRVEQFARAMRERDSRTT